jgi:hypothetical protein
MPACKALLGLPHDNNNAPPSATLSSDSSRDNDDEDNGYWEGVVELNDMAELTFLHSKSFDPSLRNPVFFNRKHYYYNAVFNY